MQMNSTIHGFAIGSSVTIANSNCYQVYTPLDDIKISPTIKITKASSNPLPQLPIEKLESTFIQRYDSDTWRIRRYKENDCYYVVYSTFRDWFALNNKANKLVDALWLITREYFPNARLTKYETVLGMLNIFFRVH